MLLHYRFMFGQTSDDKQGGVLWGHQRIQTSIHTCPSPKLQTGHKLNRKVKKILLLLPLLLQHLTTSHAYTTDNYVGLSIDIDETVLLVLSRCSPLCDLQLCNHNYKSSCSPIMLTIPPNRYQSPPLRTTSCKATHTMPNQWNKTAS